jgi:DNA mismatch repair protein MutS2
MLERRDRTEDDDTPPPQFPPFRTRPAASAKEAREQYDFISQALLVLQNLKNVTIPPLYGYPSVDETATDPFVATHQQEDFDDWMYLPAEEWTLQHILEAEQLLSMLLQVRHWAEQEEVQTWTPLLADLVAGNDKAAWDDVEEVLREIKGSVVLRRVRSVMDPTGKSTFSFQLSQSKYSILRILQQKIDELQVQVQTNKQTSAPKNFQALHEELETKIQEIERGLVQVVFRCLKSIDTVFNWIAQLDLCFAKAFFGVHGCIPNVSSDGQIVVDQFVHPLLLTGTSKHQREENQQVVPIDLRLPDETGHRALIISGPNGGGKSLAMKSFGLVAVFCKLGIPIPMKTRRTGGTDQSRTPRVDFFDHLMVSVGDLQNVEDGQSTFTAQLNAYSSWIDELDHSTDSEDSCLLLLDELGGGTEASAGGAIGQAILEKFLETYSCRIVATTHSTRLKTFSFESSDVGCAAVLLSGESDGAKQRPTYQLQYGIIGESCALLAAMRCEPSLPEDVLQRASGLMSASRNEGPNGATDTRDASYIRSLTQSLEKQVDQAKEAREKAEEQERNTALCQRAMMSLASAYDAHLAKLEDRVHHCYRTLQEARQSTDNSDYSVELLGATLSELRTVKRRIKSEVEVLKERGLRILPESYELSEGESVVIINDSQWEGTTGTVAPAELILPKQIAANEVVIVPSLVPWDVAMGDDLVNEIDPPSSSAPLGARARARVFRRYQIAVWDYDSVWEDDSVWSAEPTRSIPNSKRKLDSLLSSLKETGLTTWKETNSPSFSERQTATFSSSRERKAASRPRKAKRKRRGK